MQDENKGLDNFGIGVDKGGIALMDNVDTVYKWLPDTLAKYSTGEVIRKRKLYSDKEQVEFRGDAALVINSVKPYFASDPGCNARLLVVRVDPREGREERDMDSELKKEILLHRDASLSTICRLLQQILADKVRVMENLGLRHNDWGGVRRKIGTRITDRRTHEICASEKSGKQNGYCSGKQCACCSPGQLLFLVSLLFLSGRVYGGHKKKTGRF